MPKIAQALEIINRTLKPYTDENSGIVDYRKLDRIIDKHFNPMKIVKYIEKTLKDTDALIEKSRDFKKKTTVSKCLFS